LPWELPDHLKHSDQFISICSNWQKQHPGMEYSPELLLSSITGPPPPIPSNQHTAAAAAVAATAETTTPTSPRATPLCVGDPHQALTSPRANGSAHALPNGITVPPFTEESAAGVMMPSLPDAGIVSLQHESAAANGVGYVSGAAPEHGLVQVQAGGGGGTRQSQLSSVQVFTRLGKMRQPQQQHHH
jgi:hypothetical protein